ncbi:MAG TPA: DUF6298 domain-containing protein [Opitutaceae bacterium]
MTSVAPRRVTLRGAAAPVGPDLRAGRWRPRSVAALCLGLLVASADASEIKQPFVSAGPDGALTYAADDRGNRIPDFSAAGYGGGGVPLPACPVRVVVTPIDGDDGERIQRAIDHVATLAPDAQGLRGAVLLARGRYEISGQLRITASGVVLRGEGAGEDGTVLVATGTDRRTLIEIEGQNDLAKSGATRAIADDYVPVGAVSFNLADATGLRVGSRVLVERPSTAAWIEALGMNDSGGRQPFAWKPGTLDLAWDRTIIALEGNRITLDAPITTALAREFGGGGVSTYAWPGRISQVGVERLRCISDYNAANPRDEQHAWMAIALDAVENAWLANVTAVHFVSSAVQLGAGTRAVTVQDCVSLAPVSELGGYRRHTFHTSGQLTLFQRCRAEDGLHDFTVGYLTCGPNVFLDCRATLAHGFSGSIGSWASGALFDNVLIDGASLDLDNRETWNQGVGWAAANSVLWQSSASIIRCRRPPTAQNWAIFVWGEYWGDGWWQHVNEFANPDSLYRAQLAMRRGEQALAALPPLAETAAPAGGGGVAVDSLPPLPVAPNASQPLALSRGWLVSNGALLTGTELDLMWWRGSLLPARAREHAPALTRFTPGRKGRGATDDLDALTDSMVAAGQVSLRHHYGLWYDRRRDDHQMIRRATPEGWPPFFEQPFARSGQGEAWDRLSRYDLTKYNPWYFRRLREFAGLAGQKGLVLVNEMYFQHNIIESGAHWVDSPWRPVNNLQQTGFTEPPPFTGDTIKMADEFYDVTHPVRRELHRAFIRQCLENLAEEPNVIHTLTAENSGPLHFMQFWLDVVVAWEGETGRRPLIALSAPKNVQDAVLADPKRAALIDVIDLTYWWRTDAGDLYAPAGGQQLAPRQHLRLWKKGKPGAASVAAMVREYRERFPDKAVITGLGEADGWAFVAAGGSLPKLPRTTDAALRASLPRLQPLAGATVGNAPRTWALGDPAREYFVCSLSGEGVTLDLREARGRFTLRQVDPKTGYVRSSAETIVGGRFVKLTAEAGATGLWWITSL